MCRTKVGGNNLIF